MTNYLGGHPEFTEKINDGKLEVTSDSLIFSRYIENPAVFKSGKYEKVFSIPLKTITGTKLDTARNVNLGKVLLVGLFAFGWKDKVLAVTFKDDMKMINTAVFIKGKLDEINNQIISNRYQLLKKVSRRA